MDETRSSDLHLHIDPGFVHLRHCLGLLSTPQRNTFEDVRSKAGDPVAEQQTNHLLVDMLVDKVSSAPIPTLADRLLDGSTGLFADRVVLKAAKGLAKKTRIMPGSRDRLVASAKPEIPFDAEVEFHFGCEHIVSTTFLVDLCRQSTVQVIGEVASHSARRVEVRPYLMGRPTLLSKRLLLGGTTEFWTGLDHYELRVDDISEFSAVRNIETPSKEEWSPVMRNLSEAAVKQAICEILGDEPEKDWGGEEADHFTAHLTVFDRRRTAAFLLKGPAGKTKFKPMTPAMLGKQGDQIYRLSKTAAQVLVLQHCHDVRPSVRSQLENAAVRPHRQARYCIIDGRDTYRLLKAYAKLPAKAA